ncbi:MAG: DUF2939 domain-containing protein [Chthoniobacterales bacterium]|nr:DUF2939 domain-containing protein [Chthoniobacterales bacterium]
MEDAPRYSSVPALAADVPARRRSGRWWLIGSAIVLLLLFYIASPYYAFWRFTNALRERDAAAIEQRVDFQALRKSMKQQLNAKLAELRPKNPKRQKLFDTLSNAFGSSALDSIVDAYLTPEGLAAFLANPKLPNNIAAGSAGGPAGGPSATGAVQPRDTGVSRGLLGPEIDWSRVRYAFFTGPRDFLVDVDGTKLRFRLRGVTWQLRGVEFDLAGIKL